MPASWSDTLTLVWRQGLVAFLSQHASALGLACILGLVLRGIAALLVELDFAKLWLPVVARLEYHYYVAFAALLTVPMSMLLKLRQPPGDEQITKNIEEALDQGRITWTDARAARMALIYKLIEEYDPRGGGRTSRKVGRPSWFPTGSRKLNEQSE